MTDQEASEDRSRVEIGSDGPSTILVAADGSPTAQHALAYAAGLARRQHARLLVVYVRQPPAIISTDACVAALAQQTHDQIQAQLREVVQSELIPQGIDARLVTCTGEPAHALADVAARAHADVIVVGASTNRRHRIAGSIPTRLVRHAHWPITVVP